MMTPSKSRLGLFHDGSQLQRIDRVKKNARESQVPGASVFIVALGGTFRRSNAAIAFQELMTEIGAMTRKGRDVVPKKRVP